ncbi:MAG: alpha-galactosidase [Clostridia bacterium]|nr:alpha-galactosidase [Clostridia bacterium]
MRRFLLLTVTAGLLLLALTIGLASCDKTPDPTPDTSDTPAVTNQPTEEDTQVTDTDTTEEETEPTEVFKPDPQRAVPKYDALMSDLDTFPLTFTYGETEYKGFAGFALESETYEDLDRGVKSTLILRHPEIPAAFRLEATVYPQESAYEYVVYITNDGQENTAIFSDLAFEMEFVGDKPLISGIKGDAGGVNYTPYEHDLEKRARYSDRSTSGRPSHGTFPYYNLSYGNGGTFIAIGWPGTWYATYTYKKSAQTTTLSAGQEKVATYIAPGETLRTPLMGFVEYENLTPDEQTNAWRHYYIHDVMRKIDGELTPTYRGIGNMSAGMTTKKELLMLKAYRANGVTPDVIWMDAGWYTGANGESVPWTSTGSLEIDYNRFPDGLSDIGSYAKNTDAMYLLWFEPENMRLDKNAFLAGQPDFKEEWLLGKPGGFLDGLLMDLGNPECREWIFNRICKVIDQSGATGYRQDFNNDPAPAWAENDAKTEGRTGMTENQYVQGYLALWDALIDKYGLFIDSCASGGGRNDLESMKRGVPLHYTDWFDGNNEDYDMKGKMTQALFAWFPYFKNESYQISLYKLRMNYAPFCLLKLPSALNKDNDWALMRQAYAEYDTIRDYFYGDFYALTEWTSNSNRWDARMFFVPEEGEGYAFIACQQNASSKTNTVKLKGLDPDKQYTLKDFDGLVDLTADGKTLMEQGITVTVPEQPYAVIVLIKEVK